MVLYFKETKLESKEMAVEEVVVGKEIVKKSKINMTKQKCKIIFLRRFFLVRLF